MVRASVKLHCDGIELEMGFRLGLVDGGVGIGSGRDLGGLRAG